ncbi:MAG: peptide chain release factor 1 [Candidatus Marinimicrobia bacterium]|nr:peptide chain release factor 1 [Candidatus Neomarinimicrobiota bacterium]
MINKLEQIINRYDELGKMLTDPEVISNQNRLREAAREHNHLEPVVKKASEYISISEQIADDKEILTGSDEELKSIAQDELRELEEESLRLEEELKVLMLPKDLNDDKNTIIEIRAGTGGEEAALFAANLFRMYTRFAERQGWKQEVMETSDTGIGGFKEVIFSLSGKEVYGWMKYESGVHRVQRVPKTEASGRIHTSAATVAVLPEAEEAEIAIAVQDLKIDTYRASGAGGQHVNKTESAIRITHLPSGLVVTCQDEKSQHKNRAAALKVLRSRLLAQEQEKLARERSDARKTMVSTGDRSAKIRTYNFPQGRITDHRIGFTAYRLEEYLDGDLLEMIERLRIEDQKRQLAAK